jgi:hypothetical protein
MKTKKIFAVLAVTLALTGCNSGSGSSSSSENSGDKIIGCWQTHHKEIIEFAENGEFKQTDAGGEYTAIGKWKSISTNNLFYEYDYKGRNSQVTLNIVAIDKDAMVIKFNGFLEYTWSKTNCK